MPETIEFTTPIDIHQVVIRAYMTGRDELAMQQVLGESMQVKIGDNSKLEVDMGGATLLTAGDQKALELLLISVDGETDGLIDRVLDMKRQDYRFVKAEINKVTRGLDEEKKSDSPDSQLSSPVTVPVQSIES